MPSLLTTPVDDQLQRLTLDQKLGQLLHPFLRPGESQADWDRHLGDVQPGGVFIFPGTREEMARATDYVQKRSSIPVVIASDLENGAGRMISDATVFPDLMAVAAADDEELAYTMGEAAAREGREAGIHWTFAPVIDINANPQNPITNTRSLGDVPARILRLASALVRGMQDHGLAATIKHFPGDGYDCRDQHVCTTINPLSMEQWRRLSGRLFRELVEQGVWSVMPGHIALPAWDPGNHDDISAAPPATLSRRLLTDLLRGELGFDGLIVSDASFMGGVTSWGGRDVVVPGMINAGNDQVLFCEPRIDFDALKRAVEQEVVPMQRIDEAVRRVLQFKHLLGLFGPPRESDVSPADRDRYRHASEEIARKAITLVTDRLGALPTGIRPGSKVLSYHLRGDAIYNVDGMDDLLRGAGAEVVRRTEEHLWGLPSREEMATFDAILVHVVYGPSWNTNRIRLAGNFLRDVVLSLSFDDPRLVFISYGTPYVQLDLPRIPCLLNAYSPDPTTQRAVLDILLGKAAAQGTSPVDLGFPDRWFLAAHREQPFDQSQGG